MKIHEYQARQILSDHGIPVPPAEVVRSPDEAADAFKKFAGSMCVVKAQVYAGGRGKAGFVKLVRSADEAREAAKFMLTHRMTSVQTGPEGVPVSVLLVAPGVDIAKEYYLGITIDRSRNTVTMIASRLLAFSRVIAATVSFSCHLPKLAKPSTNDPSATRNGR